MQAEKFCAPIQVKAKRVRKKVRDDLSICACMCVSVCMYV